MMQQLGRILANSAVGQENQATLKAAAIVAASSKALQTELRLEPNEARAIAYRRGQVIIRVAHGAIGGQILMHQPRLLEIINKAAGRLYPATKPIVERMIIRSS